jgi:hypothetical protein
MFWVGCPRGRRVYSREDDVIAEGEHNIAEAASDDDEDDGILSSSKPSHIEFGKSIVMAEDLIIMKKLGYFGKK